MPVLAVVLVVENEIIFLIIENAERKTRYVPEMLLELVNFEERNTFPGIISAFRDRAFNTPAAAFLFAWHQ